MKDKPKKELGKHKYKKNIKKCAKTYVNIQTKNKSNC